MRGATMKYSVKKKQAESCFLLTFYKLSNLSTAETVQVTVCSDGKGRGFQLAQPGNGGKGEGNIIYIHFFYMMLQKIRKICLELSKICDY